MSFDYSRRFFNPCTSLLRQYLHISVIYINFSFCPLHMTFFGSSSVVVRPIIMTCTLISRCWYSSTYWSFSFSSFSNFQLFFYFFYLLFQFFTFSVISCFICCVIFVFSFLTSLMFSIKFLIISLISSISFPFFLLSLRNSFNIPSFHRFYHLFLYVFCLA